MFDHQYVHLDVKYPSRIETWSFFSKSFYRKEQWNIPFVLLLPAFCSCLAWPLSWPMCMIHLWKMLQLDFMSLCSSIAGKNKDDIQRVWANKSLNGKNGWLSVSSDIKLASRRISCTKLHLASMHQNWTQTFLSTSHFHFVKLKGYLKRAPESSPDGADVDGRGGEEPAGYHGYHHHGLVVVLSLCRCSSQNSVYPLFNNMYFLM